MGLKIDYLWLYVYVEILAKFYLTTILLISFSILAIFTLEMCYTGSDSSRDSVEV